MNARAIVREMFAFIQSHRSDMPTFDRSFEEADKMTHEFPLDENGCIVLELEVQRSFVHVTLKDLRHRQRSARCHSGKEYIRDLRYLIDNFWSRYPGIFSVSTDVASKEVFPKLVVPRLHVFETLEIAQGRDTLPFTYMSEIYERVDMEPLRELMENVIAPTNPTVADGSMRISDFATGVANYLFTPGYNDDPLVTDVLTSSRISTEMTYHTRFTASYFLVRVWFACFVPTIARFFRKTVGIPPSIRDFSFTKVSIDLAVFTAFSYETPNTWYMQSLGLGICPRKEYSQKATDEFRDNVLRFRARLASSFEAAEHFHLTTCCADLTIHELAVRVMTRSRNHSITYFDLFVIEFVTEIAKLSGVLSPAKVYPCRTLVST